MRAQGQAQAPDPGLEPVVVGAVSELVMARTLDPHERARASQWMDWMLTVCAPAIHPLFWGLIMFAIALRGGGPYSFDRRIGKEL